MSLLDVFADWLSESATIQRGEAPVAPSPVVESGYAVQVAAAPDSARADEFVRRLRSAGYSPRVVFEEDRYKVRTELFASRTDAMIALEKLRGMFGDAFVVDR